MPNPTKILIIGAKGMLGTDLVASLQSTPTITAIDIAELDITNKNAVSQFLQANKPNIVINCAAYTNVDDCEYNREAAFLVNAEGPRNLAESCRYIKAKLIHYSTDYVFDGSKETPYTEEDLPNPLNLYGESKLKGEQFIQEILCDYLIIRTSWLFGKNGKNFISTILKLAKEKSELKIVNDQIGSPTYTVDLAEATKLLISINAQGIFNLTNSNHCSWHEFARKILELSGANNVSVIPITSNELNRPAKRPKNSVLSNEKLHRKINSHLPTWQDALHRYLLECNTQGLSPESAVQTSAKGTVPDA